MFTGKIYRNKPIQLDQSMLQTEFIQTQQPLRKVQSGTQLIQTFPSFMNSHNHEDMFQDRERPEWGSARQYVEKCERRMRERLSAIQRRYNLSLSQLQGVIEEKDLVIQALKESLLEKQQIIQTMKRQNDMALSSSRMMIQQTLSSRR